MVSKTLNIFFLILILILINSCKNTDEPINELLINEFLAINNSIITDEFGEYDDWVEIFNSSNDAIDIGGYYISDRIGDVNPYMIPNTKPDSTIIQPQGYIILWCDKTPEQGMKHLDFKLSGDGESIVLIDKNGEKVLDEYTFGAQTSDVSMGRVGDEWVYFENPTPGKPN